jgi:hypothetical protein
MSLRASKKCPGSWHEQDNISVAGLWECCERAHKGRDPASPGGSSFTLLPLGVAVFAQVTSEFMLSGLVPDMEAGFSS